MLDIIFNIEYDTHIERTHEEIRKMAAKLSDAQIALVKEIGYSRIDTDYLFFDDDATFDTLITAKFVRLVKSNKGNIYELSKKGLKIYEAMIEAEVIPTVEIDLPTETVEGAQVAAEIETDGVLVGEPAMEIECATCGKLFLSLDSDHTECDTCDEAAADLEFDMRLNDALIGTEKAIETTRSRINFNSPEFIERLAHMNGYPEYKYTEGDCMCGGPRNEYGRCVCKKSIPIDPRDAEIERLKAEIAQLKDERDAAQTQVLELKAQSDRRESFLKKHREFVHEMCGYSFSDRDDARFVSDCVDELERS